MNSINWIFRCFKWSWELQTSSNICTNDYWWKYVGVSSEMAKYKWQNISHLTMGYKYITTIGNEDIVVDGSSVIFVECCLTVLEVCTGSKLKPEPGPYPRSSDPTRPDPSGTVKFRARTRPEITPPPPPPPTNSQLKKGKRLHFTIACKETD